MDVRESQKQLILMDCKIMMNKLGDIPFDISFEKLQTELWNIGNKYGISGPEVFKILMDNFPKKGGIRLEKKQKFI
ncbi:hypothetical protein BGV20_03730 [Clostridioides difficile]|nr:hypothetical protein [Clostridioides difficile]PBE35347.1 hypothetical protein BGU19_07215 [Clostridioides difficile]PBH24142.1 hypothetical protein BGV20_03730 [Clostridioides difficile]